MLFRKEALELVLSENPSIRRPEKSSSIARALENASLLIHRLSGLILQLVPIQVIGAEIGAMQILEYVLVIYSNSNLLAKIPF